MFLVFDMGGSKTRLALVDDEGRLGEIVRFETDRSSKGFAKLMGVMEEMVSGRKLTAVAGGMPGHLDGPEGALTLALNLPEWTGLPVRARLEKLFDCPVSVFNDVVLGGLGEAHKGAGNVEGVMAYFTVSTGINAARIVEGRIDSTVKLYQMGQQIVGEVAGRPTMLESLVGGAAMEARLGKKPREIRDPVIWEQTSRVLARAVYNTMLYWTPRRIVFGGSMMRDIELEVVTAELDSLPLFPLRPELKRAKLGDLAGLHGAVAWLRQA